MWQAVVRLDAWEVLAHGVSCMTKTCIHSVSDSYHVLAYCVIYCGEEEMTWMRCRQPGIRSMIIYDTTGLETLTQNKSKPKSKTVTTEAIFLCTEGSLSVHLFFAVSIRIGLHQFDLANVPCLTPPSILFFASRALAASLCCGGVPAGVVLPVLDTFSRPLRIGVKARFFSV